MVRLPVAIIYKVMWLSAATITKTSGQRGNKPQEGVFIFVEMSKSSLLANSFYQHIVDAKYRAFTRVESRYCSTGGYRATTGGWSVMITYLQLLIVLVVASDGEQWRRGRCITTMGVAS